MLPRFLASVLAALLTCASGADGGKVKYVLIVDAGSSGSRLRMYDMRKGAKALFPKEADEDKFETEPGISSYADTPAKAGPSLKGMVQAAMDYIPKEDHADAKFWVKATAGMRVLPQDTLKKTFDAVNAYLQKPGNCPFDFVDSEVLGGEEEALFAYLSMNFILGTKTTPEDRVGILDMGGASMQIAHKPSAFILANEFSFYVEGVRQSVYAKSFIKFGLATAVERAQQAVAKKAGKGAKKVDFPCFLKGYEETKDGVKFVGTGDSEACADVTLGLLHREVECLMGPCPIMGVHMAPFAEGKRFYGISNFFYVTNGLGLIGWGESKNLHPSAILKAAADLCGKDAGKAKSEKGSPWKYRKYHCFGGHYVYNVLKAFGFKDDTTSITFARKIKGQAADWSLGSALYETQYMPLELQSRFKPCPKAQQKWQAVALELPPRPLGGAAAAAWLALPGMGALSLAGVVAVAWRRARGRHAKHEGAELLQNDA